MRVLILADDCNPDWPSLPIVGYKAARAIAEYVDVVVVTHIRNRENIEKAGLGRAHVRYVDNEYVAKPMFALAKYLRRGTSTGWTTAVALAYPSYVAFEREAWKATRDELRRGEFDLVHRLTPMSPTLPSPLASWSPVPFVIGPLNGGLSWPPGFRKELAREREWLSYVRSLYRFMPYQRSTFRNSSAILCAFSHTMNELPKHTQSKAIEFPEVGIDPEIFIRNSRQSSRREKHILFVGRLVPYKMPQLLVQAYADQPALRSHRLTIVGDGPERSAIEQLIRTHRLENVTLTGWKTQLEIATLMCEADIFAFPSIRELGAGVVVEAMACGLACVVINYGAPSALIGTDRGIKVQLADRATLTRDFGQALARLVSDDQAIAHFGASAREHAMRYYTWDAKARKMIGVYEWALAREPRPDFWKIGS